MNTAWDFKVECDDEGWYLYVDADDDHHRFRIADPDQLYAAVRSEIGPWVQERDADRMVYLAHRAQGLCTAWIAGVGPCAREYGHDGDCGGEAYAA